MKDSSHLTFICASGHTYDLFSCDIFLQNKLYVKLVVDDELLVYVGVKEQICKFSLSQKAQFSIMLLFRSSYRLTVLLNCSLELFANKNLEVPLVKVHLAGRTILLWANYWEKFHYKVCI